jgi:NitT/TauT family transport system ATP-binding protein
MHAPIITIQNVSKTYPRKEGSRRVEVFKDVNLSIHKGEFLVLLGPSGCGKSTLLRIISKLDHASTGFIGYSKDFSFDRISFVFQNFGILPWLTVFQNVELNLIGRNVPVAERAKRIKIILEQFGLHSARDRFPHELSGGMKQRVGLARAFVTNPDVIFLDEPFSELDFFTATTLRNLLLDLWTKQGTTVVMVSHYIDEAVTLADRIAIFSDRPGTIKVVVKNELARPRVQRSPEFFKMEDEALQHFKV